MKSHLLWLKVLASSYAKANGLDEITYMGQIARGKAEDLAVQNQIEMDMMVQFMSLIFTWEQAKRKVRQGGPLIGGYAKSMVSTREKIRSYYQFMSQDMVPSYLIRSRKCHFVASCY